MKNFIQPGKMVTAIAPSGGVVSGNAYLIGSLFGVAATSEDEGSEVEILTVGVVELPKTTSQAWAAAFAPIYWDNSTKRLTTTSSGNTKVGINMRVESSDAAVARVRLNGVF